MATKDILMDGDKVCIAWFKKKIKKFILSTSVEPVDSGTVTGAGTYNEGTVVTVEAIPNPDFEFDHWGGNVPNKWSGLGMCVENIYDTEFNTKIDELIANGFTQIRITISDFNLPDDVDIAKAKVLIAIAKGVDVTWGIGCSNITLTAANWEAYRTVVKDVATWAQANGVYEFVIGNEEERHNDDTTLTDAQVRTNIRSLATEVQAIFTRGQVTYGNACLFLSNWISEGIGDLDQIGWMVYGDESWQNNVDSIIAAFGVDHAYINEWNVDSGGYYQVPTRTEADEAVLITQMIEYFKTVGITRVFFFLYTIPSWYEENTFEVLKEDGTYRLLWNSLLDSN